MISMEAATSEKPPVRKPSRRYLLLIASPAICIAISFAVYWWMELRPQYLYVDLPDLGNIGTTNETVSMSFASRNFYWHQTRYCSGCENWHATWEHFDTQLTAAGWEQLENPEACASLPESVFLPEGEDGFVVYHRQADAGIDWCPSVPTVCLAIWKAESNGYHIAISTENASPLTYFDDCSL